MSIVVEHLTKIYGTQHAVDGISFSAQPGDILGFLGPNGAGKSTTMKILTGYLPQTFGTAFICGLNVETESVEVRRHIGYLPENNPLYTDLYIKEYLAMIAGMYNVAKPLTRIKEMLGLTGLEAEQQKKIGQLSRGYRQRVGIAAALIHNPAVIIMDEPTSGLDPNQVVEIRQLIKNLGTDKTIILSTHIMSEVESICTRAIIINKGKIVADDNIAGLKNMFQQTFHITVQFKEKIDRNMVKAISGVMQVDSLLDGTLQITAQTDLRDRLFEFAVHNKLTILSLQSEARSLEDVFRTLTT